ADRAHAMRTARAVALRACVERGRADLVLRAALGRAAVGLLFLGYRHRAQKATRVQAEVICAYSSFSSRSFAQRGSGADSWWCSGPAWLRSAAHIGHSPAQSSRQRIFAGSASASASRAQAVRSSDSSRT